MQLDKIIRAYEIISSSHNGTVQRSVCVPFADQNPNRIVLISSNKSTKLLPGAEANDADLSESTCIKRHKK